jgi:hypothetical protein
MKKSILWYIAICSGALYCAAVAILTVMYSKDIYSFLQNRVTKVKSVKDRALIQLIQKPD